jgi:hypothetical protein
MRSNSLCNRIVEILKYGSDIIRFDLINEG